ncbi:hypothetical protein LCDVSa155L [Lymphocystis disease virus 3]|uniref:Uncharacterized protein n=1 Tax=Lymphocystis disease virus 3 TaxID=2560566 RepID=A0A1B2RW70_9VIRU|nr:hypothetical protein BZK12_gp155 [Lymphocystis disease virus Sa]AOC55239.1 hypothetical protein LCDVSa155L [Lymphocystis disease virus 3]
MIYNLIKVKSVIYYGVFKYSNIPSAVFFNAKMLTYLVFTAP